MSYLVWVQMLWFTWKTLGISFLSCFYLIFFFYLFLFYLFLFLLFVAAWFWRITLSSHCSKEGKAIRNWVRWSKKWFPQLYLAWFLGKKFLCNSALELPFWKLCSLWILSLSSLFLCPRTGNISWALTTTRISSLIPLPKLCAWTLWKFQLPRTTFPRALVWIPPPSFSPTFLPFSLFSTSSTRNSNWTVWWEKDSAPLWFSWSSWPGIPTGK